MIRPPPRQMWHLLESHSYVEAQQELIPVAMPFMELWAEMDGSTGGDCFLDKLCVELVGVGSSRCRPPTRDVRPMFRERTRQMMKATGVPQIGA